MGESKIPKPPPARPFMSITRLQAAVNTAHLTPNQDETTKQFIADLGAVLGWITHLEGEESGGMSVERPN